MTFKKNINLFYICVQVDFLRMLLFTTKAIIWIIRWNKHTVDMQTVYRSWYYFYIQKARVYWEANVKFHLSVCLLITHCLVCFLIKGIYWPKFCVKELAYLTWFRSMFKHFFPIYSKEITALWKINNTSLSYFLIYVPMGKFLYFYYPSLSLLRYPFTWTLYKVSSMLFINFFLQYVKWVLHSPNTNSSLHNPGIWTISKYEFYLSIFLKKSLLKNRS